MRTLAQRYNISDPSADRAHELGRPCARGLTGKYTSSVQDALTTAKGPYYEPRHLLNPQQRALGCNERGTLCL
jgi:hypothetical protein